jgi:putative transposase
LPRRSQDFERKLTAYGPVAAAEIGLVSAESYARAKARENAVKAFLVLARPTRADALRLAATIQVKVVRFYALVKAYKATPNTFTLLKLPSSGGRGEGRLGPEREAVCRRSLDAAYLSVPLALVKHAARDARGQCVKQGLPPVSRSTVYRRALDIPEYERVARKQGTKEAREQYGPQRGQTPPTTRPLQRIQIDHTPWPQHVVDEEHRLPIGCPYLTLLLDECSRAILGFALTLQAPSSASLARAIVHAVMPKAGWLEELGLGHLQYPMYGKWSVAYLDNAAEFVTDLLVQACDKNGMKAPEHRPGDTPNFGGHIESAIKTAQIDARTLPGARGSKPKEAGRRHKPEDHATMTLREANIWFAHWVMTCYHVSGHSGLQGRRPIDVWNEGIYGTDDEVGIGLPEIIRDRRQFELDFMPHEWRTIQTDGVLVDWVHYIDDVLTPFIMQGSKRKYLFKIDPYDARVIYFLHPDSGQYFEIHCANRQAPHVTVAELDIVRAILREKRKGKINEQEIWEGVEERRAMAAESGAKTKKVRREAARKKEATDRVALTPRLLSALVPGPAPPPANEELEDTDDAFSVLDWRPS